MTTSLLTSAALLLTAIAAQSTFEPARPPAIPLAVRTPYLSTWQAAGSDGGNGGYLAGQWPSFWAGQANGWCGLIKVDDQFYTCMGDPTPLPTVVNQTAFEYTSTKSIFTMDVGGMVSMKVTFLSPVDPQDELRQSLPVSYMSIEVRSSDGAAHDVSLYTDISAEWTSGDRDQVAKWDRGEVQGSSNTITYHKVWRQLQQEFSEDHDQAAWGNWYFAAERADGLTYQSGANEDVRAQFINEGGLANTDDTDFRAINDRYPVFGFAKDLGRLSDQGSHSLFTINLLQQNSVQFATGVDQVEHVPASWRTRFADEESAIAGMYDDYEAASGVSNSLDARIQDDARRAAGDNNVSIATLAVRQAYASFQIAGTNEHHFAFLKEISSNGNFQTVDVVFPLHPIILYLSPAWMKLLLDPLFINMESPGLWPQDFAIHDLGEHYPNATGHSDGNAALQPLEESGNMLIMTLAYAQKTGDKGYLDEHWSSLRKWAEWLITNNTVIPFNQISTDDFAGPLANQTNLALKGIIGLKAASVIANLTGHQDEAREHDDTAQNWIGQWQQLGVNSDADPPHTVLNYGHDDSWGLLYNLWADALLHLKLVPREIYEQQSNFYPTVASKYGVPLDTRATRAKSDWQMFCAAIASEETRDSFVTNLAQFINETPTAGPLTDLFDVNSGDYAAGGQFRARPVVGGFFALLALDELGIPSRR